MTVSDLNNPFKDYVLEGVDNKEISDHILADLKEAYFESVEEYGVIKKPELDYYMFIKAYYLMLSFIPAIQLEQISVEDIDVLQNKMFECDNFQLAHIVEEMEAFKNILEKDGSPDIISTRERVEHIIDIIVGVSAAIMEEENEE